MADEEGAQVPRRLCLLACRVLVVAGLTCVARVAIAGDEQRAISNEPEVHVHLVRCYHRFGVGAVAVFVVL